MARSNNLLMPTMAAEKRLTNKRSPSGSYKVANLATENVLPFECEICGKFGIFCHIRHNNYQHKFKDEDSNIKHTLAMRQYLAFVPNQRQDEIPETIEYTELPTDMEDENVTIPESTLNPKQVEKVTNKLGCELCDFIPQTSNPYREKKDHQISIHFKDKIDKIIAKGSRKCPDCSFVGRDNNAVTRHYVSHGSLKKWLKEALSTGTWYTSHDSHYTGNPLRPPLNVLPNPQNDQVSVSNEPTMILCSKCGKGFSDERDLKVHMYVHP